MFFLRIESGDIIFLGYFVFRVLKWIEMYLYKGMDGVVFEWRSFVKKIAYYFCKERVSIDKYVGCLVFYMELIVMIYW